MQTTSDDVVEPLLRAVHDFANRHIAALRIDAERRIPREVLEGMAELGLFGITLPEEYGGAALPALAACRVVAAMAQHDRSVATTLGLHLGLGTRGLVAWGAPELKAKFLPDLASGRHIAAFATTEPGAGSDLSAIATRGVARERTLVLNGQKIYVTNGGFAQVYTVTASTPGLGGAARGTSLVTFSADTPGVTRLGEEHKLGLKGSSTITLMLEDAEVPLSHVLGTPGTGGEQLAHVLSWGRLLLSSGCLGSARFSLQRAIAHVHERKQFGKVLAAQEVVQRQLTEMSARVLAMRALVEAAAQAEHDWAELARLTTSAKVVCSEGAWSVCDLALQLHGGSGYIEDTGLALPLRDARVPRIFEGANDVLLTHLGMLELGRAWTPATPRSETTAQVKGLRESLTRTHGLRVMGRKADQHRLGLACAWRDAAEATHALASRTDDLTTRHLARVVETLAMRAVRPLLHDDLTTDPHLSAAFAAGSLP